MTTSPARPRVATMALVGPALLTGLLTTLLIALPIPLVTTSNAEARPDQEPAAPVVATAPPATAFPTSGLTTGPRPRMAYAYASDVGFQQGSWRLHRPDRTTLRLPRTTWSWWAAMGRGAIGMAGTEAGPLLEQVAPDGRVRDTHPGHPSLAVSPDHRIVGWLGRRHTPHVVEGAGTRTFAMPPVPRGTRLAAIEGSRTCREQLPEGGGCSVFVDEGRTRAWVSTSHGIVTVAGPMRQVSDVSNRGLATGLVSAGTSSAPSCWGLFSPTRRLWQTCDYRLGSFAPGGRRVLAERTTSAGDVRRFAILRADGRVVRSWTVGPGVRRSLSQLTWEDSRHLLGVLFAHGHWSVVRIGSDGSVEHAVRPVARDGDFSPYLLPLR